MEIGSYEHVIALSETLHRRLAPDWSLNDLIGEPLLVPKDSLFPAYSQFMNDAMDAAAFAPRRSVRPNDLSILLAQVASGDGFAFLPLSLTKFAYPGVAFTALPAAVNEGFRLPVGLAVSPTSRLRASETQFECFVETARRVAAG